MKKKRKTAAVVFTCEGQGFAWWWYRNPEAASQALRGLRKYHAKNPHVAQGRSNFRVMRNLKRGELPK